MKKFEIQIWDNSANAERIEEIIAAYYEIHSQQAAKDFNIDPDIRVTEIKEGGIQFETGLYQEMSSKRCPVYTTERKSEHFGGIHHTLEGLIKEKINLPELPTHRGTNASWREERSVKYKITIEKIRDDKN